MIWLVVGGVGLVVLLTALAVAGGRLRITPLPEPVSSTPGLDLPAGSPLTAEDLETVRFDTGLRGYDPAPVDAFLEEWATALREPAGATPPDPREVTFAQVLRGYRMDQVDEVLDRLDPRP